jgi:zinc/manganese transport system permease protein
VSIDWILLAAPFAAGMLVLATHVPLGVEVLRRGIIFIDLAVAQVAALGVIAADLAGWESYWATQAAAATAALGGALLLTWCERRWPDIQEALIGLLFVTAAAIGILLLANNPHGGDHFRDLLAGQILWVGWAQLGPVAVLYAVLMVVWLGAGVRLGRVGFYATFALAVTASVQLVGVLLVFASLIAPAIAFWRQARIRALMHAWIVGILGYAGGLAASARFDLPAGATIVTVLSGMSIFALAANSRVRSTGKPESGGTEL